MQRILPLLGLIACATPSGSKDDPSDTDSLDCGDVCPEGTRKSSFEAVIRGQGGTIVGEECETVCETIVPCSSPNVPTITATSYACEPLEGYVKQIPPDVEVDFSWADNWVRP